VKVALHFIAGAALLALVVWYVDPRSLARSLAGADALLFALAVLLAGARNLAAALRWGAMARALGLHAPVKPTLILSARSITASIMLPGAMLSGDVLRSYQLSQLGNPLASSAWSVFLDRFSGLWVLFGMSAVAAAWLGFWAYAAALAIAFILPLLPLPLPARGRLGELAANLRKAQPVLLASAGYSFLVQLFAAGVLWLCGLAVGAGVSYAIMLAAAAPIFVMASLPIGIGGFGAREAASVAVLGMAGVAPEQALAIGLLYGLASVVLGIAAAPLFLAKA
jgi:glycosyltransferase 2 family protein